MENNLITIYLLICRFYNNEPLLKYQRLSNFKPIFTDEELLTVYLFGHIQGMTEQKQIYNYIQNHWKNWFPFLPSYQAFNRRLNEINTAFELLIEKLLSEKLANLLQGSEKIIDSLPIMLARGSRSGFASVARDVADKGYCASKSLYYYGVKLHSIVWRQIEKLPVPEKFFLTSASKHDLTALQETNMDLGNCFLYADKAYACKETFEEFLKKETKLVTPIKAKKVKRGEKKKPERGEGLFSSFVSSIRQPIESFFNWLIQRTDIQNASSVRSTKGLLVHCYGKLAVACLLLTSYS